MICNPTKTEFIVFGNPATERPINVTLGNTVLSSLKAMKVLGIMFDSNLKWDIQVNKTIAKCSSVSYSLRLLNKILPRNLHRQVIYSHFISHLMYGSPIWAGCIKQKDTRRLSSCLNKMLRLHCYDFKKNKHNYELCAESKIRSFKSQVLVQDAKTLYRLVTQCNNFDLTQRLTQQSTFVPRYPSRISFIDYGRKRVARNSFINRAKAINASIPFDWVDLVHGCFDLRLKKAIPLYL